MAKLIADENLASGAIICLAGEPFVHEGELASLAVGANGESGRDWGDSVGVITRNVRKGDVLDYEPGERTSDVISGKISFTVASPGGPYYV